MSDDLDEIKRMLLKAASLIDDAPRLAQAIVADLAVKMSKIEAGLNVRGVFDIGVPGTRREWRVNFGKVNRERAQQRSAQGRACGR